MGIRAGRLRHRIQILDKTLAKDDLGGFSETNPVSTTIWAEINPRSAGEAFDNAQTEHTITHEITVRDGSHLDGLGAQKYVKYGNRTFEIRGVRNSFEIGEFLIIDAVEQPATAPAVQA